MFNTLATLCPKSKYILVRADLNVPVQGGRISDTTRLARLKPTVQKLREQGGRIIILSHFGRPMGLVKPELSLSIVADALSDIMHTPVLFAKNCIGLEAKRVVDSLRDGDICVLENVRFHEGEEQNDENFARELAQNGDIYVNDAFSVSHRAHASTHALAKLLPAYIGLNTQRELEALTKIFENPSRPLMAIVGGSKVSSKLDVLLNLVKKVDILAIGGGMANTFLCAQGIDIGASLYEKALIKTAQDILYTAKIYNCKIILPQDVCVAHSMQDGGSATVKALKNIEAKDKIFDVGHLSCAKVIESIKMSKTLLWNGPLGAFEFEPFDRGTNKVAHAIMGQTQQKKLISVAGGGDTVFALRKIGGEGVITYTSTAGGAFLEWIKGKDLPGISVLKNKV